MAVIEAMSYGIPCVLTPGTNMLDVLEDYDAGWAASIDKDSMPSAILQAVEDNNDIIQKGKNVRQLVADNYAWAKIIDRTIGYC